MLIQILTIVAALSVILALVFLFTGGPWLPALIIGAVCAVVAYAANDRRL